MEGKEEISGSQAQNRCPIADRHTKSSKSLCQESDGVTQKSSLAQPTPPPIASSPANKEPGKSPPSSSNDLSLFVEAIEAMRNDTSESETSPIPDQEVPRKRKSLVVADKVQVKKSNTAKDTSTVVAADAEDQTQDQAVTKPASIPREAADTAGEAQVQGGAIELQECDILAGNRSKRAGNRRYRETIRECAIHVGEIEMRAVVDMVLQEIAPGRFVRFEGESYVLLKEREVVKKVNNALRDMAGLNRKALERQRSGGAASRMRYRKVIMGPPSDKISPTSVTKHFDTRTTDVLGGYAREKNPGNAVFHELILKHLADFDSSDQDEVIARIIAAIYNQKPPGRFLAPNNFSVLSEAEVKAKVWVALNHEHQLTLEREDFLEATRGTISQSSFDSDMTAAASGDGKKLPSFQLRTSDVLGGLGKLKSNPGNVLFRDLVTQYVDEFESNSQIAITTIMEAIRNQDPPGRFLTSDNQSTLSKSQARNKVRLALHNKHNKKKQEATINGIQPSSSMTSIDDKKATGGKLPLSLNQNQAKQILKPIAKRRIVKPPLIITQSTDVLGEFGKGQQSNPGNVFFNGLVSKHGADFYSSDQNAIIQQIIDAVHVLEPPGRFLSPNNKAVLDKAQTHAKVWVALNREYQLSLEKSSQPSSAIDELSIPAAIVSTSSDDDVVRHSRKGGGETKKQVSNTASNPWR